MGYPKSFMPFNSGMMEAITSLSVATFNKAMKLKTASRTIAYVQQVFATAWDESYKGPFDGRWTQEFADKLEELWSEQFGSEPSGKYKKDADGNYPLAFIRDLLSAQLNTNAEPDYPPVVK